MIGDPQLDAAIADCAATGKLLVRTVAERPWCFLPLFAAGRNVEAVLATAADVAELPLLLHALHAPVRAANEEFMRACAHLPLALPSVGSVAFDAVYTPPPSPDRGGGDWYDAFVLANDEVAIAIGDVASDGLTAVAHMGTIRRLIRETATEANDPAAILALAHRAAAREGTLLATIFFGIIDPATRTLRYACAGHPPPVCIAPSGDSRTLAAERRVFGGVDELTLETHRVILPAEAALVLYTDGCLAASPAAAEPDGRLHEILGAWARGGFAEDAAALQRRLLDGTTRDDDAALFVVRIPTDTRLALTIAASIAESQRARRAVQGFVSTLRLEEGRASDFVLAIAEATNNAAEHAYADGSGTVAVTLELRRGCVVAVIADSGRWRPRVDDDRGRGLAIMQMLTDECDVRHGPDGTSVTLAVRLRDSVAA